MTYINDEYDVQAIFKVGRVYLAPICLEMMFAATSGWVHTLYITNRCMCVDDIHSRRNFYFALGYMETVADCTDEKRF